MVTYRCDGCGMELDRQGLRYSVEIQVRAVYDKFPVSLLDLVRDHRAEMLALIERMKHKPAREIEESVYKAINLDLCPTCQRAFIHNPLRFHPEQGLPDSEFDIDAFLRSLGIGGGASSQEGGNKAE